MDKQEALTKVKKLEEELSKLKDIINKPEDIFEVTTYKELCKRLGEKAITSEMFSCEDFDDKTTKKLIATAKIKQLERFFNEDHNFNWSDSNKSKYYIWLERKAHGWVFNYSYYFTCHSSTAVGYYKSKKIADYIGNNKEFLSIYIDFID